MKVVRMIVMATLLAATSTLFAQQPQTRSFPADTADVTQNGDHVLIAVVPNKFQVRFTLDEHGRVANSVVIETKTNRIVGFNNLTHSQKSLSEAGEMVRPQSGPPTNDFTGVWLIMQFPGGGQMYGEYSRGTRIGTIIVQANGLVEYYKW